MKQIIKNVENFREENKIESPKCISDRILLYVRYALDMFTKKEFFIDVAEHDIETWEKFGYVLHRKYTKEFNLGQQYPYALMYRLMIAEQKKELFDNAMELYGMVRGDMKYTNSHPIGVAAAIIYLSNIVLVPRGEKHNDYVPITLMDISYILDVAETTITKYVKMMKKDFDL